LISQWPYYLVRGRRIGNIVVVTASYAPGEAKYLLLLDELHKRRGNYDAPAVESSLLIAQIVDEIFGLVDEFLRSEGLSRNGYGVLLLLRARPDMRPLELSRELGVSKSAMTGLLETLVNGGLITRTPAKNDKRSVEIRITGAGEAVLAALIPGTLQIHQDLIQGFGAAELKRLGKFFERVRDNVRRLRKGLSTSRAGAHGPSVARRRR
jgi:DNA-binding MarR family transcriptional regulator